MTFSKNTNYQLEFISLPHAGRMNLFVGSHHESRASVWSFAERRKISEMNTILDFGGHRLAMISHDRPLVATGSWDNGICAYLAEHGEILWSRSDLKHIQHVCDLSDDKNALIGVGLDSGAYRILKADTGQDYSKLPGIKKVYASPFEFLYLLEDSAKHVHLSALTAASFWKKPLSSFALLHAAFSPKEVAFSEAGGSVFCFDFYGTKLWEFQPDPGCHILRLVWNQALQRWLAISWQYQMGGPKFLLEINNHGVSNVITSIGQCAQEEFSADGRYLFTSTGQIISTESATVAWEFL